jgi:hypothetical protein
MSKPPTSFITCQLIKKVHVMSGISMEDFFPTGLKGNPTSNVVWLRKSSSVYELG